MASADVASVDDADDVINGVVVPLLRLVGGARDRDVVLRNNPSDGKPNMNV